MNRTKELNNFISFVLSKPKLHNIPSVIRFFDISISETKYGSIIEGNKEKNYKETFLHLKKIYPKEFLVF